MRFFLAFFIALSTAIWTYSSLYIYNCRVTTNHCDLKISIGNKEIVLMLLGMFIFGFIFGNIVTGTRKKKKIIKKIKVDKSRDTHESSIFPDDMFVASNIDKPDYNQNHAVNNDFFIDNIPNVGEQKEVDLIPHLFHDFINKTDKDNNIVDTKKDIIHSSSHDILVDETPQIKKTVIINKSKKYYNPDEKSNFELIEDAGDDGFTLKKNHIKKDESILKIHKKTTRNKLTQIEGIGPKIEKLLNEKNIYTFNDLANTDAYKISAILAHAGTRFQMHNPKTWPKQAELAGDKKWSELKEYQDRLKGGKE